MSINAMTEEYEEAELFGRPVLFTNGRLDRATVPQGWYCYDLRGGDDDPGAPAALEEHVGVNHAGPILSPEPFSFEKGKDYLPIEGELGFLYGGITLQQFCELYGLENPKQNYIPHPASPDEAGLFYAQTRDQDEALGAIGHVRMDFGRSGKEFWHTWWPRGPKELNSPEFKEELGEVIDKLRETVLKDLPSMRSYCNANGGAIDSSGPYPRNYGYTVETERYTYRLRCTPTQGDYNAYLSCFDKQAQKLAQAQTSEITMGGMQL